jgi:hypothetical protein
MWSSGLLRTVGFWLYTNISEVYAASIFREMMEAERSSEILVFHQ